MRILVHDFLTASAERFPGKPALICGEAACTFRELDAASDAVACHLQRSGIVRGDRVAVFMNNSIELVIAMFGILKAGGVFLILNPALKKEKLAYILNDCGVRAIFAQPALESIAASARENVRLLKLPEILAEPHAVPSDPGLIDEDLCTIIYTSGSTGQPKGVMLTHRNMTNTAWSISTYIGNVPEDVVLCALPLSFDYGLYQVITGARVGFTVVLEASFAFPFQVLKDVPKWRVTGFPGVPTMFATILQMTGERLDLSSIRYVTNTAAVLPPDHIRRLQELLPGAKIFSMYGLTECTRVCYLDPALINAKPGSVGKAMPNSEIYLVDEKGKRLPNGSTGKLVLRGANVMRGYWGKPAETAQILREGDIPGEMVMHSGDVFRTDDEGFLYFMGRSDDIFKCKGEKVSPREIEDVLHASPLIAEAAVVGTPDPIDGMAVKAVVVPSVGVNLTEQDVRKICRAKLESHLVPKFVEIRSQLPKTDSGKVKKTGLG